MPTSLQQTPGAKMMFLIKRRPETSREELIAHWFANHMPGVIEAQQQQPPGRLRARRYLATLFHANRDGVHPWDGVAQLWFDAALPRPKTPHGQRPRDSFQERAMPYVSWATQEYVVLPPNLPTKPLTLNAPFPTTRSGFLKVTFLVATKADTDHDELFKHWLDVHVPNVLTTLEQSNGFGYLVSHSLEPQLEPYAGMAELYFHDVQGWDEYRAAITADGMERWVDPESTLVLRSDTEMVGID